jgi:transposase
VFLILDNLRVHHSKDVQKWLALNREKIEVFFLPPYAPELNPDEYLNGDLKQRIRSGIPPRTEKDIISKTRSFMKTLQCKPDHVRGYFRHPMIAYAA